MKAILVDDEKDALKVLKAELEKHCQEIEIVKTCDSPIEALKLIPELKPDIVFLDIDMPQITGLEILKILGRIDFAVIFVTAFNQYAVEAFKLSAVHYLLKPVANKDLIDAVNRAKEKLTQGQKGMNPKQFEALQQNLYNPQDKRIAIPHTNGFIFIPLQDIVHLKAEKDYTNFYLVNDRIIKTVSGSIGHWSKKLKKTSIIRIHHSYAVNLEHIGQYIGSRSNGYVILDNTQKKEINVTQSYRDDFLGRIGKDI